MDERRRSAAATDEDIEHALRGMVEAEPSPALASNVMRAVAAASKPGSEQHSRFAGWRLAFAASSVLVLAAALWFGVGRPAVHPSTVPGLQGRPAQGRGTTNPGRTDTNQTSARAANPLDTGTRARSETDDARKPAGSTSQGTVAGSLAETHAAPGRPARHAVRTRRNASAVELPIAGENDGTLTATIDLLPDVPPLHITPIPNPAPVVVSPVVVAPIDIPDIQITPVGDQDDAKRNPSSAPQPNEKRPTGDQPPRD